MALQPDTEIDRLAEAVHEKVNITAIPPIERLANELLAEILYHVPYSRKQYFDLMLVNKRFHAVTTDTTFCTTFLDKQFSDMQALVGMKGADPKQLNLFSIRQADLERVVNVLVKDDDSDELRDSIYLGVLMLDGINMMATNGKHLDVEESTRAKFAKVFPERPRMFEYLSQTSHFLVPALTLRKNFRFWAPLMRCAVDRLYEYWISKHGVSDRYKNGIERVLETADPEGTALKDILQSAHRRAFEATVIGALYYARPRTYLDHPDVPGFQSEFSKTAIKTCLPFLNVILERRNDPQHLYPSHVTLDDLRMKNMLWKIESRTWRPLSTLKIHQDPQKLESTVLASGAEDDARRFDVHESLLISLNNLKFEDTARCEEERAMVYVQIRRPGCRTQLIQSFGIDTREIYYDFHCGNISREFEALLKSEDVVLTDVVISEASTAANRGSD